MRATKLCGAVVVTLAVVAAWALAQEIVPTPDPIGGAQISTGAAVGAATKPAPAANPANQPTADQWRYRQFNGRWWYWTPQNRWVWYSDDGRWVEFDANHTPPAAAQGGAYPAGYYANPGPGYYPPPGYWAGRYPGVGVGVGPYGNVGVGVGQRIGVDVSGPHGGVRVGRIQIGW